MLDRFAPEAIKQRVQSLLKSGGQPQSPELEPNSELPEPVPASTAEPAPAWPSSENDPEIPVDPACPAINLCGLATSGPYRHPKWRSIHSELATYSVDLHVFSPNIYRKGWEWTQTAYGLGKLGLLRRENSGVGVGAGREALIFWLGDRVGRIVATDLYGNTAWATNDGREADPGIMEDPARYCPRPVDLGSITFLNMDGTELAFSDNCFDFAWSMSSIEHFGSHEKSARAVREMARVIRPGGVVAITTEYLLLDEYTHPEYFNRQDVERYLIGASSDLELVEPIDYTLPEAEYLIDSVVVPQGVYKTRRHIVLNDGAVQWTSIMIFLRKRGG